MSKILSIIVAIASDNGIGFENKLLTHLSDDLKRFKEITKGHTVVMGRNTWFSLPKRPLSGRLNIVISNQEGETFDGAETVYSIEEAIEKCPENEESFIIGGAMIYQQFFDRANKLYITRMHKKFPADTFFPEILPSEWSVETESEIFTDQNSEISFQYTNFSRNKMLN